MFFNTKDVQKVNTHKGDTIFKNIYQKKSSEKNLETKL